MASRQKHILDSTTILHGQIKANERSSRREPIETYVEYVILLVAGLATRHRAGLEVRTKIPCMIMVW